MSITLFALAASLDAAEPLAQQYVVVHKVRDLDDPAKAVCVGTPDILQLPSGRLIASMELWLKRPTSGDEGGIDYPNHCKIKASDDGGMTWRQISTNGITWGSLFYVNDALHMIGNDPHRRDIRIIRSPDGGKTWSKPVTLFDDSRYHGSATPVHVKDGFIYRAFEDMNRGSASLVVAGDLSKDLFDLKAWRTSNKVEPPRETPSLSRGAATKKDGRDSGGNWFLEGNVVEIRGELYVLLRTRIDVQLTAGLTSICKLEDDGRTMKYRFVQFYPMPGGQNKFKIIYDEKSGLYWTCGSMVPDPYQPPKPLADRGFSGNPGNTRRILMLSYSIEGLNWFQAGCVAMSRNPLESFHYSSQVIVGDDLLVLSRSSIGADNEYRDYTWKRNVASGKAKLPYNNHDSNTITLHRVKNFRSLALDLKPDFDTTASKDESEETSR
ncbi:MAG: sialidase family protein [Pirellulaceae bacterium]|nr:sialidase family protein [Pirellulaceae bacterium]